MKRFGEELKSARESRGISLQEISKETKINQKFIEEIENGNFNLLPQTYIRAFIRAYAKYIGLNPNDTIKRYEQYLEGKFTEDKHKVTKTTKPEEEKQKEEQQIDSSIKKIEEYLSNIKTSTEQQPVKNFEEELPKQTKIQSVSKPKINYSALFIVITAVVIILVFVLINLPEKKSEEPEKIPFERVIKETEQKYSEKKDTIKTELTNQPIISTDSLTLGVLTDIAVWVNVKIDNNKTEKGIIEANNKKYFRAKERFTVVASKGTKIKLFLNEKLLGSLSQTDSLSGATVTPEGLKTFKVQKKPPTPKPDLKMMELKPLDSKHP